MGLHLKGNQLVVLGQMTGPFVRFGSRSLGYFDHELFDHKGTRWGVRFLAKVRKERREENSTYGWLYGPSSSAQEARLRISFRLPPEALQAAKARQLARSLKLVDRGIQACFDLAKCIRRLPSGKKGAFESFQAEIGGRYYWGSFLIIEKPYPEDRPLSWDRRRGASAGIPTLGKRR